ncbi:hypothetical protein RRG08_062111 [Elysia crispata]|uniref:Uncharacterized protein n=1 Tax=Elysia crispata TaxID=231223 RepID=A0AAE1DH81_9GAST|nr:hypothetical protein RRG08_062111 [Elysia crispata]
MLTAPVIWAVIKDIGVPYVYMGVILVITTPDALKNAVNIVLEMKTCKNTDGTCGLGCDPGYHIAFCNEERYLGFCGEGCVNNCSEH